MIWNQLLWHVTQKRRKPVRYNPTKDDKGWKQTGLWWQLDQRRHCQVTMKFSNWWRLSVWYRRRGIQSRIRSVCVYVLVANSTYGKRRRRRTEGAVCWSPAVKLSENWRMSIKVSFADKLWIRKTKKCRMKWRTPSTAMLIRLHNHSLIAINR